MEPFLGQISVFGFNFAPYQWAPCAGQIMPIQQNAALFSLLGTYYGGNGTTNFGLPNMAGMVAVGQGQMLGGQQSTRSILHLSELFRLAEEARVLKDPDLAVRRMKTILATVGID